MLPLNEYPFRQRPLIVAHRGDTSTGAAENSVAAVEQAAASGADMIEVDVQLSADEQFFCYHDEVSADDGVQLHRCTEAELRARGIAMLWDVIRAAKGRLYLNCEIKEYSAREPRMFMNRLTALMESQRLQDEVLFSSFRPEYLQASGWHIPTIVIRPDAQMVEYFSKRQFADGSMYHRAIETYLPSELVHHARATGYGCSLDELSERDLQDIQQHQLFLSVYTIRTEEEFRTAVARGVHGMVCENPSKFAALRDEQVAKSA